MAENDPARTTTPTEITAFKIGDQDTDGLNEAGETVYNNENFTKFYGKYKSSTKLKSIIKKWATWVVGLGLTEESKTEVLERISGSGEDTILSVLWNMLIIKKVNGDAYAEIIRDGTELINLKPLGPSRITVVFDEQGIITRYEQRSKVKGKKPRVIQVENMFHLVNDRVADETHGDSVIDSLIWNLEASQSAKEVLDRKIRNSGILGVLEVDSDDTTKLSALKAPIKEGMEKGLFLMIPKGILEVKDWVMRLNVAEIILFLNHLDDEFHQILGIPKVIAGGSGDIEGDSKISYVTFEPDYRRAIKELEDDFWNQVALRIEFNLPPSLIPELQSNEAANTSQTGFQPNDVQAGVGA